MANSLLCQQIYLFGLQVENFLVSPMIHSKKQNKIWMAQIKSNMDRVWSEPLDPATLLAHFFPFLTIDLRRVIPDRRSMEKIEIKKSTFLKIKI